MVETIDIMTELNDKFLETNDTNYIDNAIGLAEDLVLSEEKFRPVLDGLHKARNSHFERENR